MIKKTYNISGMDCASCATALEIDLEDIGVNAKCSYASQKLEVEYDSNKVEENKIIQIIKSSGFTAS